MRFNYRDEVAVIHEFSRITRITTNYSDCEMKDCELQIAFTD